MLPSPVQFSDVIQPIDLACSSSANVDVFAIGNGSMHPKEKNVASTLQYAHMKTISNIKCSIFVPKAASRKSVICAQGEEKQSICHGDSGGPLIGSNLIGITSFSSAHFGCNGAPQGNYFQRYFFKMQNLN